MKEKDNEKPVLTDEQLGLGNVEEPKAKKQSFTKETSKGVKKADDALKNAAATAALKAAIDANFSEEYVEELSTWNR